MKVTNPQVKKLLTHYKQISLLNKINALLDWDLNVNLPEKGSLVRAEESSYLSGLITDQWLNSGFMKTLEEVQTILNQLNEDEKAIVRNLNRAGKYYFKVPKEIIVKKSSVMSKAFMVWQKARTEDKFGDFAPYLEELVELDKVIAKHLGFKDNPYDVLLDLYEPGLTFRQTDKIFKQLQPKLTLLLKKVIKAKDYQKEFAVLDGQHRFPADDQRKLSLALIRRMNYDLRAGRLDVSAHPFTLEMGQGDVRITTRFGEADFRESITSTMHEAGHALYEQNINPQYEGTPLEGGVSFAIHESQSRFWENQIGRSPIFLEYITPTIKAFYPDLLAGVGYQTIVKMFNAVKPSFIRIEADEVTYCLHIILRFELENDLINGKLKIKDLPKAWNLKVKKYLGIVVPNNREGVLQDVHWSQGNFGYFPTYALGNLYAAQFVSKMRQQLPVDDLLAKGELETILYWLKSNIYQHGAKYWPDELIQKVTGEALNPKYFINYLKQKYTKIYP